MKSVYKYFKPYRLNMMLNALFNLFNAFFGILSLVLLKPFLDILFEIESNPLPTQTHFLFDQLRIYFRDFIATEGRWFALSLVCICIIFSFLLKNASRFLALYCISPVRMGIESQLRKELMVKILSLPLGFYHHRKKGDLLSRCSNDLSEIQWSILKSVEIFIRAPFTILGSLLIMIWISPSLTIFAFGLIIIAGLLIGRIGKALKKSSAEAQSQQGVLISYFEESMGGLRIIQAFLAEKYILNKFQDTNKEFYSTSNHIQRKKDLASPLSEFLGIIIIACLLLYGGNLVFTGFMEASTFITFIMMFYNIIEPAKSIASASFEISKGKASFERIQEILEADDKIVDLGHSKSIDKFEHGIQINKLNFSFVAGKEILKNIDMSFTKGSFTAIVGPSGSGKSTLIDLLLRFYETKEGSIEIDGIPISQLKLKNLRSQFGLVNQEPIIINDSIKNNISFGYDEATEEEIIEAAKNANAWSFIEEKEGGLNFVVGDRGNLLSGGQKQRIALARALLRKPSILLLDEATSALDSESESIILETIQKLRAHMTLIVIAHRMTTILGADQIYVLDDGKITESGSHEELIKNQSLYAELYYSQMQTN